MNKNKQSLLLLHTNDIHSHLEQAAQIATMVAAERQHRSTDEILLLDIGDHMDRMRMETEGSWGQANVQILNETGYDAITLGNNEGLTYTPEQLAEAYREHAAFQIIGSNIHELDGGQTPSWMLPYSIVEKGSMRIGLIGVTAAFTDFYRLLGWNVSDPYEATAALAAKLRPEVDLLVVMSHLGLMHDRWLAEHVPGIDLILGGHTHHLLEQAEQLGQTYICAAGKFGAHLGKVEIEFDAIHRTCRIVRAGSIGTNDAPQDSRIMELIEHYYEQGQKNLNQRVVLLDRSMPTATQSESPLGNLLAAGLRKWTNADIGLVNAGQFLGPLEAGEVTLGMLHRICPSPINPCLITLTGKQLLYTLEEALMSEFVDMPIRGFGFRGKVLGTLCVDGIEIIYDPEQIAYTRIVTAKIQGKEVEPETCYQVGTLDMFTFGIGYRTLQAGICQRYYLPEFIRDILGCALQQEEMVRSSFDARWKMRYPS